MSEDATPYDMKRPLEHGKAAKTPADLLAFFQTVSPHVSGRIYSALYKTGIVKDIEPRQLLDWCITGDVSLATFDMERLELEVWRAYNLLRVRGFGEWSLSALREWYGVTDDEAD